MRPLEEPLRTWSGRGRFYTGRLMLRPLEEPLHTWSGRGRFYTGRLMLKPREEPLRTWSARRGEGGVDAAGGRLRRPGPATRTRLRLALHRSHHAGAVRSA